MVEETLFDVLRAANVKLTLAAMSSCSCLTKTPIMQYHTEDCTYRLIMEARDQVSSVLEILENKNIWLQK